MKLSKWLKENKKSVVDVAYETGLTYHQVYYCYKGKTPVMKVAYIMQLYTKGAVEFLDMMSKSDLKM